MKTEKKRAFLINFAYFGVIAAIALLAFRYVFPIVTPFVIAFVIAYFLQRPVRFLEKKMKLPHKPMAIISVLMFYGIVGTLITLSSMKAVSWLVNIIGRLPNFYITQIYPYFLELVHNVELFLIRYDLAALEELGGLGSQILQPFSEMISQLPAKVMDFAAGFAVSIPGLFINIVVMVISTFFITSDYERLTGFCFKQLGEDGKQLFLEIKEYVVGTLFVCIGSYLIIMSLTFVELSIALSFIGIKHAILVALCIAVFDILPVLGTGGIMIPWAVIMALTGNYPMALELTLIYVAITVIRNIVEPKIIGGQLGLHPVVTLVSMFVGVDFFGVVGLFGFPIALSLMRHLNNHGVIKVFK